MTTYYEDGTPFDLRPLGMPDNHPSFLPPKPKKAARPKLAKSEKFKGNHKKYPRPKGDGTQKGTEGELGRLYRPVDLNDFIDDTHTMGDSVFDAIDGRETRKVGSRRRGTGGSSPSRRPAARRRSSRKRRPDPKQFTYDDLASEFLFDVEQLPVAPPPPFRGI